MGFFVPTSATSTLPRVGHFGYHEILAELTHLSLKVCPYFLYQFLFTYFVHLSLKNLTYQFSF